MLRTTRKQRDTHIDKLADIVCTHFPTGKGALKIKTGGKPMAGKAADKWWATIKGDKSFIQAWMPKTAGCHVSQDDIAGRYVLTYPDCDPKSVAWTRRGLDQAAVECLLWFWEVHKARTGEAIPLPF